MRTQAPILSSLRRIVTHLAAALGREAIRLGYSVLFSSAIGLMPASFWLSVDTMPRR
jgi:hypothetical protein